MKKIEKVTMIGISEKRIEIYPASLPPCQQRTEKAYTRNNEKREKPTFLLRNKYKLKIVGGDIERIRDERDFVTRRRVDIHLKPGTICEIDNGIITCSREK